MLPLLLFVYPARPFVSVCPADPFIPLLIQLVSNVILSIFSIFSGFMYFRCFDISFTICMAVRFPVPASHAAGKLFTDHDLILIFLHKHLITFTVPVILAAKRIYLCFIVCFFMECMSYGAVIDNALTHYFLPSIIIFIKRASYMHRII